MPTNTVHHSLSFVSALTLGSLLACSVTQGPANEELGFEAMGGAAGEASTGGAGPIGGAGPTCGESLAPPRTVLCAGGYWEQVLVANANASLATMQAPWACIQHDYYYPYPYETGCDEPDCSYEEDSYPATGGAYGYGGASSGEGGGFGMGGAGTGGIYGTGGISSGGAGGGPSSGGQLSDWCDDLSWHDYVAGVSFASGSCQASELRTPIRFREPHGFYQLRVFSGDSACERGELLQEIAGYGTGELIELPGFDTPAGFVSIELTAATYREIGIELNALRTPRTFTEEE